MFIAHLALDHFRNLVDLRLEFQPAINIIYGENALGKTSVLEAVYYLAFGKSFRTANPNHLITQGHSSFCVAATLQHPQYLQIASARDAQNHKSMKLNHKNADQLMLNKVLPLQIIYASDTLGLYVPRDRVKLMDRGAFLYFGQDFWHNYHSYATLLVQYRAALKSHYTPKHLAAIQHNMLPYALQLHAYRQKYLTEFIPQLQRYLPPHLHKIAVQYYAGWNPEIDLCQLWAKSYTSTSSLHAFPYGPHRCNLTFNLKHRCITKVLSRGEIKLVMIAIKLAQESLHALQNAHQSIYLVDDLSSELDAVHQHYVLQLLRQLDVQVLLTNITPLDVQGHTIDLAWALKSGKKSHL